MSANQTQSLNRLLKKLSAVRATLQKDERILLDRMVVDASIEVEQHGLVSEFAVNQVFQMLLS